MSSQDSRLLSRLASQLAVNARLGAAILTPTKGALPATEKLRFPKSVLKGKVILVPRGQQSSQGATWDFLCISLEPTPSHRTKSGMMKRPQRVPLPQTRKRRIMGVHDQ